MSLKSNVSYIYDLKTAKEGAFVPPATLILDDADYDETVVDLEELECVTITQTDEAGNRHTVVLGRSSVQRLLPYLKQWNLPKP